MKTCGQRISELRENQKMTQGDLSSRLDMTRASLSHYETGRREPDFDTLKKFADFFHVSVDYLIGRTEDPQPSVNENVKMFEESLELSDETILERFALTVDGRELTPEEARRFIAFVRAERSLK
jgi:transcriptional regulator with XRE-family HTH domain